MPPTPTLRRRRRACPAPHSSASIPPASERCRRRPHQREQQLQSGLPGGGGEARLPQSHLRLECDQLGGKGRYTAGSTTIRSNRRPATAVSRSDSSHSTSKPRSAPLARARSSAAGEMDQSPSPAPSAAPVRLPAQSHPNRCPHPDRRHRHRHRHQELQAHIHQLLGLRPGISTRRSTARSRLAEAPPAEDVGHRLASAAALHQRPDRSQLGGRQLPRRVGNTARCVTARGRGRQVTRRPTEGWGCGRRTHRWSWR